MVIRNATQADQNVIRAIVRAAHLNPINLHWSNFLVAEDDGRVVGVGQLRPHGDGNRELASLAIIPTYQRRGIGSQITRRLLEGQRGPIYLFCESELKDYYTRFAFRPVEHKTLPPSLARLVRIGNLVMRVGYLLGRGDNHITGMRWDG